jgi:hypothetical protein
MRKVEFTYWPRPGPARRATGGDEERGGKKAAPGHDEAPCEAIWMPSVAVEQQSAPIRTDGLVVRRQLGGLATEEGSDEPWRVFFGTYYSSSTRTARVIIRPPRKYKRSAFCLPVPACVWRCTLSVDARIVSSLSSPKSLSADCRYAKLRRRSRVIMRISRGIQHTSCCRETGFEASARLAPHSMHNTAARRYWPESELKNVEACPIVLVSLTASNPRSMTRSAREHT